MAGDPDGAVAEATPSEVARAARRARARGRRRRDRTLPEDARCEAAPGDRTRLLRFAKHAGGRSGGGLWDSVGLWRALAFFAGGSAAALLAIAVLTASPAPGPAPVIVRAPASATSAGYVAMLSDPKTQKPVLFVSAGRDSDELWVRTLDPSIRVAKMSLEPKGGSATGAPTGPILFTGPCVKYW